MIIEVSTSNLKFLEAFSSETRIKIIEIIGQKPMNIKELASHLGLSSAIITKHIQHLETAGIVKCENTAGKRGMQKICSINLESVLLQFIRKDRQTNSYLHSIPVGQYSAYNIKPTCGLASDSKILGILDDPRYFGDPDHTNAALLWFGSGWVEYSLPNFLLKNQITRRIEISMEICSEFPGYNENWPSDITFYINGAVLGLWTCPGDFGETRGVYTSDWWIHGTQYGLLKTIIINKEGSFVDGVKMSDVKINDLGIQYGKVITFRIASLDNVRNQGGVTIFGKGFGNYNCNIEVCMEYE